MGIRQFTSHLAAGLRPFPFRVALLIVLYVLQIGYGVWLEWHCRAYRVFFCQPGAHR